MPITPVNLTQMTVFGPLANQHFLIEEGFKPLKAEMRIAEAS